MRCHSGTRKNRVELEAEGGEMREGRFASQILQLENWLIRHLNYKNVLPFKKKEG